MFTCFHVQTTQEGWFCILTAEERLAFWQTLCASHDMDSAKRISDAIRMPPSLYRYRSVSVNSLAALRENKMYFSSADYYDDPFDTNIFVDKKRIIAYANAFKSSDSIHEALSYASNWLGVEAPEQSSFSTAEMDRAMVSVADEIESIRENMRKQAWSIAFSDTAVNEVLWLKYADSHKGFALEYDLGDDAKYLCGKLECCKTCFMNNMPFPIYPVYYSDEKYDATDYAGALILDKIFQTINTENSLELMKKLRQEYTFQWENERITLIKKKCHEYDHEWRSILPVNAMMRDQPCVEWIPSSIILGLKMQKREKSIVIRLGLDAGINSIMESYINDDGNLDVRPALGANSVEGNE